MNPTEREGISSATVTESFDPSDRLGLLTPKRCLRKGNVDTKIDRVSLGFQPEPAITNLVHDHLIGWPVLFRSPRSVLTLWLTTRPPKKSGGLCQTDISSLRGSIPRHPGQRSSTENTTDRARYGQRPPDLQVVAWPVSSKEERKHFGSLSGPPRSHILLALEDELGGPARVTVVALPVCPLKRNLVPLHCLA